MKTFRLSAVSLATATALLAQGTPPRTEEEPVSLENVVVTAHPYGRSQADLAQPTTVLAGNALALKQASSLGELLGSEPGVTSSYFGPGASRPIIRGLAGDRVRILENSVGLLDASISSPDHAVSLDPLLIERVEVVRGPASLLYGNAAVGGVVNAITHRIHTEPPESALNGRTEFRASSVNNELAGGLLLEGQSGPVAYHFDGYRRTADDVKIPGFAESAELRAEEAKEAAAAGEPAPEEISGRIPNTSLTADGGAFGLTYFGSAGFLGVAYSGHNSIYGVPAGAHAHHEEDHAAGAAHDDEEEADVRIDLRQRRFDVQGAITQPFGAFGGIRFKLGSADYRHRELEGDEIGTEFTNRGYDSRLEFLHNAVGPFTGAVGVQAGISRFAAVGDEAFLPSSKTETRALFAFEEASWGSVTWQFGGRVEEQDIALRDGSGTDVDDSTASLSTGVVWNFADGWTLGSSLARTGRAPNAQERFSDGPHIGTNAYEIGDPNLDDETSVALDVSLRRRTGMVTGELTLFANRFDGYIYEQPTGEEEDGLDVYRYFQRDAEFYGAELDTIVHLHESAGHQFDLHFGADLVRGKNTTDSVDLPRITPARLRAGFTWITGPFSVLTDVQRVADQNRVAENESPSDGYTTVNASVGYRFSFGRATCDLFVRGSNLTDEEIRLHTSFLKDVAPLPGRNFTVGLRTSF